VTTLVNYPATLCILSDFCCNTRRCNFHRWSSRSETAPRYDNKTTQKPTVLGVRPQSYPTTHTHRSARARDTTTSRNKAGHKRMQVDLLTYLLQLPLRTVPFMLLPRTYLKQTKHINTKHVTTLTEVFACFFLSCKANARV
jgi:hypothetical protein